MTAPGEVDTSLELLLLPGWKILLLPSTPVDAACADADQPSEWLQNLASKKCHHRFLKY